MPSTFPRSAALFFGGQTGKSRWHLPEVQPSPHVQAPFDCRSHIPFTCQGKRGLSLLFYCTLFWGCLALTHVGFIPCATKTCSMHTWKTHATTCYHLHLPFLPPFSLMFSAIYSHNRHVLQNPCFLQLHHNGAHTLGFLREESKRRPHCLLITLLSNQMAQKMSTNQER